MQGRNAKDLLGGLLMGAIGLYFLVGAFGMRIGTARAMGPGYLPLALGIIMLGLAVLIFLRGLQPGERVEPIAWRPLIWVSVSVLAFGLGFIWLGLIPAIALTVLTASLADRTSGIFGAIVVAVVLGVSAWLIFSVGLGLPMPAFTML